MKRQYTFNTWDPDALKWAHAGVATRLDVFFAHRCAISQAVVDHLEYNAVHSDSFQHIQSHISQLHHLHFDRQRRQYALDVTHWNHVVVPKANALGQSWEPVQLEEWGAFDDTTKWNGYVPTEPTFVALFLALAANRMPFVKRYLQMIDGAVLAGDASKKVPKLIKVLGAGTPFHALYTLMNGFGQIVGLWMLETERNDELLPKFKAVQRRFDLHGWRNDPSYAWGDKCCEGDRALFEAGFPSLLGSCIQQQQRKDVAAYKQSGLPAPSKCKLQISNIAVISTYSEANDVASSIMLQESKVLGLDAEWVSGAGATGSRVDVLQLAAQEPDRMLKVYIFQLSLMCCDGDRAIPGALLQLLRSPEHTFVGVNIQGDLTRLGNHYKCGLGASNPSRRVEVRNFRDIARLANHVDPTKWPSVRSVGLGPLAIEYLRLNPNKDSAAVDNVRTSNWHSTTLTPQQVHYAAMDAAMHLALYLKLASIEQPPPSQPINVGVEVQCLTSSKSQVVATGCITNPPQGMEDNPTIAAGIAQYVLLQESDVLVPGHKPSVADGALSLMQIFQASAPAPITPGSTATSSTHRIMPWPRRQLLVAPLQQHGHDHMADAEQNEPMAEGATSSDGVPTAGTDAYWEGNPLSPKQRVLLDLFHAMQRVGDTLPKAHSLRPKFMARLRDVFFQICDADVVKVLEHLRSCGHSDHTLEQLYTKNYKYLVRRCRRKVGPPSVVLKAYDALIKAFSPTINTPNAGFCSKEDKFLLEKDRTQKALAALRIHIISGCISDPEDLSMYYEANGVLRCIRGTSALEGFHRQLRRMFRGFNTSPQLAYALIMLFVHHWNIRAAIASRGAPNHGHKDQALMHEIHAIELAIGGSGIDGLQNIHEFVDTEEEFLYPSAAVGNLDLDHEHFNHLTCMALRQELGEDADEEDDISGDEATSTSDGVNDDGHGHASNAKKLDAALLALAKLPMSHQWLARTQGILRPAVQPQHISDAEFELMQTILEENHIDPTKNHGHEKFVLEWTKAVHDMAMGRRDDIGAGLITMQSCKVILDRHVSWKQAKCAHQGVKVADDALRQQLRANEPQWQEAMSADAVAPRVHPTANLQQPHAPTPLPFPLAMAAAATTSTTAWDPTSNNMDFDGDGDEEQSSHGTESTRAKNTCFVCGWPQAGVHPHGGSAMHTRRQNKWQCTVPTASHNPNFERDIVPTRGYKRWLKRQQQGAGAG